MLVIVARSSTDSDSTAPPQYSTSLPMAWPLFTYGWRRISSMKSLAVTLSGFCPRTTTLTVSGTVSRTSFVIHELKIAVVPTPNATHPTAPACGVWESEPMITIPGSACPSSIFEWQIASAPWRPSRSSPYSLIPCFSANVRCFFSSCIATSSSPSLTRSGVIASGRNVRWSRNIRIEPGSLTFASLPTSCSKKIAAIGVTYSWLKRISVRTNPSSPGFTAGTPIFPFAGSTTQRRARIFSPSVMGRRGDEAAAFHGAARNRKLVATLEPQVREFAQGFVVVVTDVRRSDFVGGDVVAQLHLRRPHRVIPRQLRPHERGILRQIEDPAVQANVGVAHARSIFRDAHVRNRIAAAPSDVSEPAPHRQLGRGGQPRVSGRVVDPQRFGRRAIRLRHRPARH